MHSIEMIEQTPAEYVHFNALFRQPRQKAMELYHPWGLDVIGLIDWRREEWGV